jgi:calcineurin-like phosphoesterase family protein
MHFSRLALRVLRFSPLLLVAGLVRCGGGTLTSPSPTPQPQHTVPIITGETAVLLAAGDIGLCGSTGTQATARLLDGLPGTVITVGDNAYPSGSAESFRDCYDPTWGRHKARTRPSPGNHDYEQPGALPYFNYFGASAGLTGLGYYRFRLGDWQVFSLNSNVSMSAGSAQVQWLRRELAANPSVCTLAYWHHPLFTSGRNGDNPGTRSLWRALYDFDADVVISAHDHLYERFALQDADGRPDPERGIRQFTVGTGGASLTLPVGAHINSDVVWSINGVLELVLRSDSYTWQFLSETGAPADIGAGFCHQPEPPG